MNRLQKIRYRFRNWRHTVWIDIDEFHRYGEGHIDRDGKIWMPIYDGYDAIRGQRVVGEIHWFQKTVWKVRDPFLRLYYSTKLKVENLRYRNEEPF